MADAVAFVVSALFAGILGAAESGLVESGDVTEVGHLCGLLEVFQRPGWEVG